MQPFILSQAGIYYLKQLELAYHRRHGKRFRLAVHEDRLALLRETSYSDDQVVQRQLRQFCKCLEAKTVNELMAQGVVKTPRYMQIAS